MDDLTIICNEVIKSYEEKIKNFNEKKVKNFYILLPFY